MYALSKNPGLSKPFNHLWITRLYSWVRQCTRVLQLIKMHHRSCPNIKIQWNNGQIEEKLKGWCVYV